MSTLQTIRYTHAPMAVEAVQVTSAGMDEIAKWCKGTIATGKGGVTYIEVDTIRPVNDRQKQARAGDWVVKLGKGFKVYTDPSFRVAFRLFPEDVCGKTDMTADGQPCVLGKAHTEVEDIVFGCRSLQDYIPLSKSLPAAMAVAASE